MSARPHSAIIVISPPISIAPSLMTRLISIVPNITLVFITWQEFELVYESSLLLCMRNTLRQLKRLRRSKFDMRQMQLVRRCE